MCRRPMRRGSNRSNRNTRLNQFIKHFTVPFTQSDIIFTLFQVQMRSAESPGQPTRITLTRAIPSAFSDLNIVLHHVNKPHDFPVHIAVVPITDPV